MLSIGFCSGVIGFLLCSTEGPAVDFVHPVNPIEKLEGALEHRRQLMFYNSEVCSLSYIEFLVLKFILA